MKRNLCIYLLCVTATLMLWGGSSQGSVDATIVGSYSVPHVAVAVAIAGDYAYVAAYSGGGLQVIDITDPTNPTFAGSYDTPGFAFGVAIAGDYAYVADHLDGGLQIIDISDPTNPTLAGNYDAPGFSYNVAIAGNCAYLTAGSSGLYIIDITDPRNPTCAGSYDTPDYVADVAIAGAYAYVADLQTGLLILDISDPTNPTLAGSYDTVVAGDVAIAGGYAFVGDRASGLQIIDITDPTNPTFAGSCDTPGILDYRAQDVTIAGNYVYVPDWDADLQIVEVTVNVSGNVSSDCHGPLQGVTVDLDHPNGDMFTTPTDASGNYALKVAPWKTAEAVVSAVVPLGYAADVPSPAQMLVSLGDDHVIDFTVACLDPTGEARSMGYWKHQANVYLKNKGNAQESQVDMETNYPSEIFAHFHENGLNAIEVEGVTYVDNGGGSEPLDLATLHATLSVKGKEGMLAKAKQQYLALLLNMASEKLMTWGPVSDDGATASQALQYVAALINDGNESNDETAKDICDTINNTQLVAAGVIPLDIVEIAYAPPGPGVTPQFVDRPLRVYPNPGGVGPYWFSFSTPVSEQLRLEIYNVTGQRVATITRTFHVGDATLLWNGKTNAGGSLVPGVYFARLRTATGMKSVKFVHVR